MKIFDSSIEIWNEGGLPIGFTPETLLRKHSSRPRNKNIARAFFKAGFIDAWGRGYQKIQDAFNEYGLPFPTVVEIDGGVLVTINRISARALKGALKGAQKDAQKAIQDMIVELIAKQPKISIQSLAEEVGLSRRSIDKHLKILRESGAIARIGSKRNGSWVVLKNDSSRTNEQERK